MERAPRITQFETHEHAPLFGYSGGRPVTPDGSVERMTAELQDYVRSWKDVVGGVVGGGDVGVRRVVVTAGGWLGDDSDDSDDSDNIDDDVDDIGDHRGGGGFDDVAQPLLVAETDGAASAQPLLVAETDGAMFAPSVALLVTEHDNPATTADASAFIIAEHDGVSDHEAPLSDV